MLRDPIVREIREIRHEIERECRNDAKIFYERLIAAQQKLEGRLVCREPKALMKSRLATD